jgi:hypothetical protein
MTHTKDEAKAATPHHDLIAELLNPNIPKTEREHAALREIERLQALAAPVQEPVAVVGEDKHGPFVDWLGGRPSFYERNPVGTKFYTTPPAQLAPVPLTNAEFGEQWFKQTGRIMGTDKQLLLQAKLATEAAHGIAAAPEKGGAA